jgi:uroporphyrinogen decarboxylase
MTPLTHRERVLRALNHQEPDRVPLASFTMVDVSYHALRRHLGLEPVQPLYFTEYGDVVMLDEDIFQALDLDTHDIYVPPTRRKAIQEDVYYEDAMGVGYQKRGVFYYYPVKHPLEGERTIADVERFPWPMPDRSSVDADLRQAALALRRETDYALVAGVVGPLFATAWFLCGDDWFIDLATNAPFVDALLDKLVEIRLAEAEQTLKALGDDAPDAAICTVDDLGMQSNLLISPELYRRFIKPRQRILFNFVRSHSKARIFMHNDGAIYPLIPDFIEIGVEVLNPVQVEAEGMGDTKRLKREFGKDITFWGGLDMQHIMSFGTPAEVKEEVWRRIEDLAPGGGFVLTPRGPVRPEVPPENICAIYEAAQEYGKY